MKYSFENMLKAYIIFTVFIVFATENLYLLFLIAFVIISWMILPKNWGAAKKFACFFTVTTAFTILAYIVLAIALLKRGEHCHPRTQNIIYALHSACETYKGDWFAYPDITNPPTTIKIPGKPIIKYRGDTLGKITANNFRQIEAAKVMHKRLLFLLRNPYYVDGVVKEPCLQKNYSVDDQETESEHDDLLVDRWGNFIRTLPGRDHRKNNPIGPNFFHKNRNRRPLDIYSIGKNGVDETGNSFTKTTLDINQADDITSWHKERH